MYFSYFQIFSFCISLKFKMYLSKLPIVFVCLNNQTVSSCKLNHCMCRPQIAVSSPLPDISIWPPKTHPPSLKTTCKMYLFEENVNMYWSNNSKMYLSTIFCLPPSLTSPYDPQDSPLTQDTTRDCLGVHPNTNIKDNFTSGTLTFKIDEKSHNCLLLSLSSCIT